MRLLWREHRRKTLVSWPEAVDQRLDMLVAAATAAGENTTRSHVLAALVADAPSEPAQVAQLLNRYRCLDAHALDADNARQDLPEVTPPGPRRRMRGS